MVLDDELTVGRSAVRPTPTHFDQLTETVAAVLGELQAAGDWPVGVGLPGLVDRQGRLHAAPHLGDASGTTPIDAASLLRAHLGRRVLVDNDATLATSAEGRLGAGRGLSNFVLVTLGSGIGGGVVADGRVLRGEHGFVGEFGHMTIDSAGPLCVCGNRGCWERYASGQALTALARSAAEQHQLERLMSEVDGDLARIDGTLVEEAAQAEDTGAIAVLEEFAGWIGVGLAALTNAFDPAAFVLGGGLAGMADLLQAPIERRLRTSLYASPHRPVPDVRFAQLGPAAGAIGAALLTEHA